MGDAAMRAAGRDATPEVGATYRLTIEREIEREWVGKLGIGYIGERFVSVPGAKVGEEFVVTVRELTMNPYANLPEAVCEVKKVP